MFKPALNQLYIRSQYNLRIALATIIRVLRWQSQRLWDILI